MAICERLRIQESDFYPDGIFNLLPKRGKCITVFGGYIER
jgi:hypothetical protein